MAGDLEREAGFILGKDIFDELKEWYLYTLRGDWEYVFYVVRRSYILALIFEEITGEKMEKQPFTSYFYTDSAIPLLVTEFAARYREEECFPHILLCDDLMIHGRNIDFLIGDLEKRLLQELSEYDSLEISMALMAAVQIHVYTCSSNKLLLRERYLLRVHFTRSEQPAFYYRLSGNISSLILDSGFANATYVVSEPVSEENFIESNIKSDFIETSYQNTIQYTKVVYILSLSSAKAILTLRLVKNKKGKGYRAVPFVFLPNLDMQETQVLHQYICDFMRQSEHFTDRDKEFLGFLLEQEGLRSYSELVTMILSHTVLWNFNEKYHIKMSSKDMEREVHKVSLNYPEINGYDVGDFLRRLVWNPFLRDLEAIDYIIIHSLSAERHLFHVSESLLSYSDHEILNKLEVYFYTQGFNEEKNACTLLKNPSSISQKQIVRMVRGCGFVLRDLAEHKDTESVNKLIAYFLQMLDAGVVALSSLGGSQMKVLGFSQFAKAGEQSMLLCPLKFMEYMPFLANVHQGCEQRGRDFERELYLYQKSGMSDLKDSVFEKLLSFCQFLAEIEQTPEDWNGNFALKLELEGKDRMSQMMQFISRQRNHVEHYEKYLDSKR